MTETDTTAAPNGNDAAATADTGPALPDATALAKEVADYKDKLLRCLADMENLRRALEAVDESTTVFEGPAKTLHGGVELIERELLKVLEKHGVKRFDPLGVKFDPNLHQAIFEVCDANVAPGSVAKVIQPGYMIGERVLRPAMVGVSKGSPKTESPEQSADEQQSG